MKLRGTIIFLVVFLAAGCHPKPDSSIVFWEQPSPAVAAANHAKEIGGWSQLVASTGSMEPLLTGGDYTVVDVKATFDGIKEGDICLYKANWLPANSSPVCHMAASKSGDRWIMSGLANAHYEGGEHAMTKHDFLGKVVAAYTKRKKP